MKQLINFVYQIGEYFEEFLLFFPPARDFYFRRISISNYYALHCLLSKQEKYNILAKSS